MQILGTPLANLATLTPNEAALPEAPEALFPLVARPTPLLAVDFLVVDPAKSLANELRA